MGSRSGTSRQRKHTQKQKQKREAEAETEAEAHAEAEEAAQAEVEAKAARVEAALGTVPEKCEPDASRRGDHDRVSFLEVFAHTEAAAEPARKRKLAPHKGTANRIAANVQTEAGKLAFARNWLQ